jgi:nucleotide-binding universal stress UspA family protein
MKGNDMLRRILVPLDGSPKAETVLTALPPLARAFGATIDLVHVVPDRRSFSRQGPEDPLDWRMTSRRAEEYLTGPAARLTEAGLRVRTRVEEGGPAAVLVGILEEGRHDLVAFTPRGLGGTDALVVGSTAAAVALHAPTSILLVPRPMREGKMERILIPVDGSPRSEWALGLAARLAVSEGAEIHLVHALVRPERFGTLAGGADFDKASLRLLESNRSAALRYMGQVQERFGDPGLRVSGRILEANGDLCGRVMREVDASEADLVVLSAHGGRESMTSRLGPLPLRFLLMAPVPTLILQDLPTSKGSARTDADHSDA